MRAHRSIPPIGHRARVQATANRSALTLVPENGHSAPFQVLHCLPLAGSRGKLLQFHSFDDSYIERLRAGDGRTQEHFRGYFTELIQIKLRSRRRSPEDIDDVCQETFKRFLQALADGKIRQPERLGSYLNSMCNNVDRELHRDNYDPHECFLDSESQQELPGADPDALSVLTTKETREIVHQILEQLSERDRRLLREVFLEERDKDDVCRDFGVDREYLRVLLHRAKQSFKSQYLKDKGNGPPELVSA